MKTSKIHFLILVFAISAITFVTVNAIAADKLFSEISAATAEWVKQYNAGNAAGITALYSDDATANASQ